MKKHILIILDGYGIAEDPSVSAIDAAKKPFLDHLFSTYPSGTLSASGLDVGLPDGQMGNSEVGHMNLGAGRIVYQDLTRIDGAIKDGSFFKLDILLDTFRRVRDTGSRLHLLGLFSDGGVHSHIDHSIALTRLAAQQGLAANQVFLHAFTDGRDTDPHGGREYAAAYEAAIRETGVGRLASVIGRYWAMDRDNRWDRTEKAYRLLVNGEGEHFETADDALASSYAAGVTDEFIQPIVLGTEQAIAESRIRTDDTVLFFNFRADRARQLTAALTSHSFSNFDRSVTHVAHYVTFAQYAPEYAFPVVFPRVDLRNTLGEIIAAQGNKQLRAAETEKYPHVTYFFSGGREDPFEGEDRALIPSPKVATYDLQPEMSAPELAARVASQIAETAYQFVILNFANPDMVGHTGDFAATVAAVETIDKCTRIVVESALSNNYSISIIADHGNADKMRNEDGSSHTSHTTALVPHLILSQGFSGPVKPGILADVAPTILSILGVEIPKEMTGSVLI